MNSFRLFDFGYSLKLLLLFKILYRMTSRQVGKSMDTGGLINVHSQRIGDIAVIYAGDYLNKLSGERIEREATRQLDDGCQGLVVSFKETQLVNSIGISILLGIIDAASRANVELIFSDLNEHTVQLFDMLGLSRHVRLSKDEQTALAELQNLTSPHH
jgi:anti-anti-sigma factor